MTTNTAIPETISREWYLTEWLSGTELVWGVRIAIAAALAVVLILHGYYSRKQKKTTADHR